MPKPKLPVRAKTPRKPKAPKEEPLAFKNGRQFAYGDKDHAMKLLSGLGAIMATWKECAAVLGITEQTLNMMFRRWPDVKDAFESGKSGGKVSLRRNQFDLAKKNATMAIFLGLNYLDQQDLRQVNMGGRIDHKHEHSLMVTMLKEIDEESRSRPLIEHDSGEVVLAGRIAGPDEEAA